MIVTVSDASPRQAQGHIGDSCVRWKNFLNAVADVADQTGTVRGRIERVEMSLKPGFHMIDDRNSDRLHMSSTDRGHVANVSQKVADCYDHMETWLNESPYNLFNVLGTFSVILQP